jgi:hypothetical protein
MTTTTHPTTRAHGRGALTAVRVALFWVAAATLVATAQLRVAPRWPLGGAVATFAALVLTAYAYTGLVARNEGGGHALGVGIAWLTLTIVTELAFTAHLHHAWYGLLGSPTRPLLRNLILFVWVFAPALFARREGNQ